MEVADLVRQMTSYYKFGMSDEEIADIITRFGDQYLDTRYNYGKPSCIRLYAASEVSVVPIGCRMYRLVMISRQRSGPEPR